MSDDDSTMNAGASEAAVRMAEEELGVPLPGCLAALLRVSDGMSTEDGILLYGTAEIAERNRTFEVSKYLRGHLAIGDDSGGRVFVMEAKRDTATVWMVDQGGLGSSALAKVSSDLTTWAASGFAGESLGTAEDETDGAMPVDVYLERHPGSLANLMLVRRELGLALSVTDLKKRAEHTPVVLLRGVPYGKFRARCRRVNGIIRCLALRKPGDEAEELPG